jgi:hypothetical protein
VSASPGGRDRRPLAGSNSLSHHQPEKDPRWRLRHAARRASVQPRFCLLAAGCSAQGAVRWRSATFIHSKWSDRRSGMSSKGRDPWACSCLP